MNLYLAEGTFHRAIEGYSPDFRPFSRLVFADSLGEAEEKLRKAIDRPGGDGEAEVRVVDLRLTEAIR